jgi:hypothetical protein
MMAFLKEYWLWILAPIALVFLALLAMFLLGGGNDSPFVYNIQ